MSPLRRPPLGRLRDAALTRVEYARRAGRGTTHRRTVAIIGMHRSGTSAVAGTLQEAGLYLGNVSRGHEANRKGTREHVQIMKLHEGILAYCGGSWRSPPARIEWTDEHRLRRDSIIRAFSRVELWGFKDPRAVLLLDFWREALGNSLELVGVFREPGAVVSSLLRRDGGSPGEWFSLWSHYNHKLLREVETSPFPLVEFSPNAELFHEQVVRVTYMLGLRNRLRPRFFDTGLAGVDDTTRDSSVVGLYEELRSAAKALAPRAR